jgi:tRNA(Ile)-lysidine synthase
MAPRRGALIRPLLGLSGQETRRWCAERGLAVARDPTNDRLDLARGRVRHRLVPALAGVHPAAERHVAALADALRDEAALIDELVAAAWSRCADGPGLSAVALAREPPPLRSLLVRRLLGRAGLRGEALAAAPVARVLGLLQAGRRVEVPGGAVLNERGRLLVAPPARSAPETVRLSVPGRVRFGDAVVSAAPGRAGPPAAHRVGVRVEGELSVRSPRPGDRLPLAGGGRQTLGRLLQAAGVPARRRAEVPVVVAGDRVVWVAGHRAAPDLLAEPGARALVLEVCDAG